MQTEELGIATKYRTEFVPLTAQIADLLKRRGWKNGVMTVYVPHTTAGVTINENADPDVVRDMARFSDELVPRSPTFRHAEGNSDAHIKASFFGSSVQVIVRDGGLWLGTWQGIFFCEFDGPRSRTIYVALAEG